MKLIQVFHCLFLIVLGVGGGKAADDDLALIAGAEMLGEDAFGDAGGFGLGEAVDTGADAGEGDALQAVFLCQTHGGVVTGGQQLALVVIATIPDGSDGMDHLLTGQQIGIGHLALPRLAATECTALLQQLDTSGPVNGAIYSPTAQQTPVGGIHDRIDLERRDISYDNLDSFHIDGKDTSFPGEMQIKSLKIINNHRESRAKLRFLCDDLYLCDHKTKNE